MSYPINLPITYTAVATTQGAPSNTFTYSWAFDDSTIAATASTAKTWATVANHLATVTATDNVTGGTAIATKTITTADWTALSWVSTAQKIIPTATTSITQLPHQYAFKLLKSGNLLINAFDTTNQQTIVVFDTSSNTRSEYSGMTGAVGNILGAGVLTLGANAGNVLVVGQSNGRYGFFNPNTGAFTVSPTTMPVSLVGNATIRCSMAVLGNGRILFGSDNLARFLLYNQVTDVWTTTGSAAVGYMKDLYTLPSGNAMGLIDNSTGTYIYNQTLGTWSSGPSLPYVMPTAYFTIGKMANGTIATINTGATCPAYIWTEGNPNFTAMATNYPYTSQDASATSNSFQNVLPTADGNMVTIGGLVVDGSGKDTKSIVYYTPNDSWVVSASLLAAGVAYRGAQLNGKLWRCGSTGVLEYMVWS